MGSAKAPRASRVFIRQWLSELLVVNPQTLSMWINQGSLGSYEPEDVKAFLLAYPRALERASRGLEPIPGAAGLRRPRPARAAAARKPAGKPARGKKPAPARKTARAKPAARKGTSARSAPGRRSARKN